MAKRLNYNAIDLLKIIVAERNWHKGNLSTQLADRHKKSIINGTIKYSTASSLLDMLGYEKIKEEIWVKK